MTSAHRHLGVPYQRSTMTRRTIALVLAIVACVLAVVAAEGDGAVALTALSWVAVALGAIAASLLP